MSISLKIGLAIFALLATSVGGLGIPLSRASLETSEKSSENKDTQRVSSQSETTGAEEGDKGKKRNRNRSASERHNGVRTREKYQKEVID